MRRRVTSLLTVFSRRAWLELIIGFVLAFVGGAICALLVEHSGGWQSGTRWDLAILRRVHTSLPGWLDTILVTVPWFGTNITFIAILVPLTFWLYKRRHSDVIAQLWAPVVGNYFLNFSLKVAFGRPRPSLWPRRGEYTWASYPSGHIIAAVSVLLFVAWLLWREKGWLWPYVVWLPLFAALVYSRVYLGVHWPTDLVGGFVTGVIWLAALWLVFRRPTWRGALLARPDATI